jgi:hypothetical protein
LKHDNANQTGSAGGRSNQLNQAEEYIINVILGRKSPVISGLNLEESGRPSTSSPGLDLEMDSDEEAVQRAIENEARDEAMLDAELFGIEPEATPRTNRVVQSSQKLLLRS